MNKPTWLFIDGAPTFGGHEAMVLRWLQELRTQNQVNAVLLARVQSKLFDQGAAHARTMALPLSKQSRSNVFSRLIALLHDVRALLRAYRVVRPQLVVIAEGCLLAQAPFTFMAWLLRVPTIVYVPLVEPAANMGFANGATRDWLVRHVYRHFPSAWLTLSSELAAQLITWSGIKQPVYHLPNALSLQIEHTKTTYSAVHRPLRVLVLGRLDAHQKNLDGLLEFLTQQPLLGAELRITFVGEGPFGEQITNRLEQSPALARWVVLKPWTATIEVMAQHDVLLLASRYEGVPLVVLEAMALGLPVVATDLPGVRKLLPDECRFAVNDFNRAIEIIHATVLPYKRAALIRHNLQTVYSQASSVVFSKAVRELTQTLKAIANDSIHISDPANEDTTVRS